METIRFYQPGDRSTGICGTCQASVSTVMEYRDFVPPGLDAVAPGVLVDVCGQCGAIVAIPPQSTTKLNALRRSKDYATETIRARIPRMLEDALDLAASRVAGPSRVVRPAILRYYFRQLVQKRELAAEVKERSLDPLANCKADASLVVKLPRAHKQEVMHHAQEAGINSEAQLIRGVTLLVVDDFRIGLRACPGGEISPRPAAFGSEVRERFVQELAMVL